MNNLRLFFLLGFFGTKVLYGQLNFEGVDISDELSQVTIRSITQDDTGFLWLGTDDGLNRYDGHEIVEFRNNPSNKNSLCDNEVLSLVHDDDQSLWIGTANCLCRLDLKSYDFTNYKLPIPDSSIALDNYINQVKYSSSSNELWVATNSGLLKYDRENDIFRSITINFASSIDSRIVSVYPRSKGGIWFTSGEEIYYRENGTEATSMTLSKSGK